MKDLKKGSFINYLDSKELLVISKINNERTAVEVNNDFWCRISDIKQVELISENLLGEILGKKVKNILGCPLERKVYFTSEHFNSTSSLNICELSQKAKKWASSKLIKTDNSKRTFNACISSRFNPIRKIFISCFYLNGCNLEWNYFEADTEAESIIQACEWLLLIKNIINFMI